MVLITLLLCFSKQGVVCSTLLLGIFSIVDFCSGFGCKIDLKLISRFMFWNWCLQTLIFIEEA